ncbi:hypothetical protein TR80_010750 [Xanthomonas campestris]|nr:hypothetical protein TR80_010750 [Xanthomonas campestris]
MASRMLNLDSRLPTPDSRIPNPESQIPNPKSQIPNPRRAVRSALGLSNRMACINGRCRTVWTRNR